jgi:membrane protein involved in colicin uptake
MIKLIKGDAVLTPNDLLQTILEEPTSSWDDPETAWQDRCYLRDNFVGADLGGLQSWLGKLKINTRFVQAKAKAKAKAEAKAKAKSKAKAESKSKTKGKEKAEDKSKAKAKAKSKAKANPKIQRPSALKRPATKSTKSPAAKKATERNLLGPLGAEYDLRGMVEGVKNGTKGIKKPAAAKKVAKKPLGDLGEWCTEMAARTQAALQAEKVSSDES